MHHRSTPTGANELTALALVTGLAADLALAGFLALPDRLDTLAGRIGKEIRFAGVDLLAGRYDREGVAAFATEVRLVSRRVASADREAHERQDD